MLQNLHNSILKRNISNNVIVAPILFAILRLIEKRGKDSQRDTERERYIYIYKKRERAEKKERQRGRDNSFGRKTTRNKHYSRYRTERDSTDVCIILYSFVNLFGNVTESGRRVMQIDSRDNDF